MLFSLGAVECRLVWSHRTVSDGDGVWLNIRAGARLVLLKPGGEGRSEACGAYCLAAAIIFRSMTFLAASIAGSSVSRRVGVPFSLRNCWMYESS